MQVYSLLIKNIEINKEQESIVFRNIPKLKAYLKAHEIEVIFNENRKFIKPLPLKGRLYFQNELIKIKIFDF